MKDLTRCVITPEISTEGFKSLAVGVHRASTIVADYANRGARGPDGYSYGLYGTPTTRTLETKLTALEQGARTFLVPSGQAAHAIAVLPFLKAGDGILMPTQPTRRCAISQIRTLAVSVWRSTTTTQSISPILRERSTVALK